MFYIDPGAIIHLRWSCFSILCCVVVCVLVEQGMEWFHLDLRHLGGNLLVNRLVHELRWVHLLVCNNIAVNLTFFWGHPQIKLTDRGGIIDERCRKLCLSVSTFFRIQKVPTHFFGAFLAHMAVRPGAHCYQTDAIYTVQCKTMPHILIHKIQFPT